MEVLVVNTPLREDGGHEARLARQHPRGLLGARPERVQAHPHTRIAGAPGGGGLEGGLQERDLLRAAAEEGEDDALGALEVVGVYVLGHDPAARGVVETVEEGVRVEGVGVPYIVHEQARAGLGRAAVRH